MWLWLLTAFLFPGDQVAANSCANWCPKNTNPWSKKCKYKTCKCPECFPDAPAPRVFWINCKTHNTSGNVSVALLEGDQTDADAPVNDTPVYQSFVFAMDLIQSQMCLSAGNEYYDAEIVVHSNLASSQFATAGVEAAAQGADFILTRSYRSWVNVVMENAELHRIPNIHCNKANANEWSAERRFAFGMEPPNHELSRGALRAGAIRGLRTVAIITCGDCGLNGWRQNALSSVEYARISGYQIIGPTVSWCKEWQHLTASCRLVTRPIDTQNKSSEHCICGDQPEMNVLGLRAPLNEAPTFYETSRGRLQVYAETGGLKHRISSNLTNYYASIIRDIQRQIGNDQLGVLCFFIDAPWSFFMASMLPNISFVPKLWVTRGQLPVEAWKKNKTTGAWDLPALTREHGYWVTRAHQWHASMRATDPVFGSNIDVASQFFNRTGRIMDSPDAAVVAFASLLTTSLIHSKPLSGLGMVERRDLIRIAIGSFHDETLFGLVKFNRANQNIGRLPVLYQVFPPESPSGLPIERVVLPEVYANGLLSLPFPTWESRFGCPPGRFNTGSQCVLCPPGKYSSNTSAKFVPTECKTCSSGSGTRVSSIGTTRCTICPAGQYQVETIHHGICHDCPAGTCRSKETEGFECSLCTAGRYAGVGSEHCIDCPGGRVSVERGVTQCAYCPKGRHSNSDRGSTSCLECLIGSFASNQGQTACAKCPSRKTTMKYLQVSGKFDWLLVSGALSNASCLCEYGTRADGDNCVACPLEGMLCEGDVRIKPGYYADTDFSVFECRPSNRCRGGKVGNTCELGRTGIACFDCESGMTPAAGGRCADCKSSDVAPFVACCIVVCGILVCTYHQIDSQNFASTPHSLLLSVIVFAQFIALIQLLSVVSRLLIHFPPPLNDFLRMMTVVIFDIEVLRPNCLAHTTPVSRFILKVLAIIAMCVFIVIVHCVFVVFRHESKFKQQLPTLTAMIGTISAVCYISVVATVIAPLQCDEHPNGKWTVQNYGSVLCEESSEYTLMVSLGICFFSFPLAYLAFCAKVVYQFPRKIRAMDTSYLKAYSFLFFRVKARAYWYALVIMVRSLMFGFVPVIPVAALQIALLQFAMLVLLIVTIVFLPWRVRASNWIDIAASAMIILFMSLGTLFVPDKNVDHRAVSWALCGGLILFLAILPLVIVYGAFKSYTQGSNLKTYQFFLCHHKLSSGAYVRALKMFLVEQPRVQRKVFIDCDDLSNLDSLFDIVGNDVENLIVVSNTSIYGRPWCIGEITTAFIKSVTTRVVELPDFRGFRGLTLEIIDTYNLDMEGLEILAASGMTIQKVRDALRWILALPKITVPHQVNGAIMQSLASKLCVGESASRIEILNDASVYIDSNWRSHHVVILCDYEIMEAASSALVLDKQLLEYGVIVSVVLKDEIPEGVMRAIILFNSGCLERPALPKLLIRAGRLELQVIPLLLDEGFRVPSAEMLQEMRDRSPVSDFEEIEGELAVIVKEVFSEIAKSFPVTMASETVLSTVSKSLSKRLSMKRMSSSSAADTMSHLRSSSQNSQAALSQLRTNSQKSEAFTEGSIPQMQISSRKFSEYSM